MKVPVPSKPSAGGVWAILLVIVGVVLLAGALSGWQDTDRKASGEYTASGDAVRPDHSGQLAEGGLGAALFLGGMILVAVDRR